MRTPLARLVLLIAFGACTNGPTLRGEPCRPSSADCPDNAVECRCDSLGNVVSTRMPPGTEGHPDWRSTFCRDAHGNTAHETRDYDGDGVLEEQRWSSWNSHRRVTLEISENRGSRERRRYTYDGDRVLTREFDRGDDGTIDSRTTYHYDAAGRLLASHEDGGHGLGPWDGNVDYRWSFAYDPAGRMHTWESHLGSAGPVISRATYRYDEGGRLTAVERDCNVDGTVDWRLQLRHNSGGTTVELDGVTKGSWRPRRRWSYSCDQQGRATRAEIDLDGEGTVDEACTFDPPCDVSGLLQPTGGTFARACSGATCR